MTSRENVLIVGIVLAVAILGILITVPESTPQTAAILSGIEPKEYHIISGIDINEAIGADRSTITDLQLTSLEPFVIRTQEGKSTARPKITLTDANFNGGILSFERDTTDTIADAIEFKQNEPIFSYETIFSPGLRSKIDGYRVPGLEDENIWILGKQYVISKVEINGNEIEMVLIGHLQIRLRDTINDYSFERGVWINGKRVNAKVKIRGNIGTRELRIDSIDYRPLAEHKEFGDIHVHKLRGIRQYMREPQALLSPSFDLIYAGMSGGQTTSTITKESSASDINFKPRGNDRYELNVKNVYGRSYQIPFASIETGGLTLGKDSKQLVVKEGSTTSDFNIREHDYVLVNSKNDISGISSVFQIQSIDAQRVTITDLAGGTSEWNYDSTGRGQMTVQGISYEFFADYSSKKLCIDQDHDGKIEGDQANFVTSGGIIIEPSSSTTTIRVKKKLFKHSNVDSDETINIRFFKNSGEIDLSVSGINLIEDDNDIKTGLTKYGMFIRLDDKRTPSKLDIGLPGRSKNSKLTVGSGQAQGVVVITTSREMFMKK